MSECSCTAAARLGISQFQCREHGVPLAFAETAKFPTRIELEAALLDAAREIGELHGSSDAWREQAKVLLQEGIDARKERDRLRTENQKLRAKIEKIKDRLDSHMNESGRMACAHFASAIENIVLHEPSPETHGEENNA